MTAFQRVRKPQQAHISISIKEKQQEWLPPPQNVFKVNVDAALNSKNLSAGVGAAVIRDSNGKIVAAGVNQNLLKGSASLAEAEAMLWGLQLARNTDVSSLIIESDCLEVVQLVNNTKASEQHQGQQIRNLLDNSGNPKPDKDLPKSDCQSHSKTL